MLTVGANCLAKNPTHLFVAIKPAQAGQSPAGRVCLAQRRTVSSHLAKVPRVAYYWIVDGFLPISIQKTTAIKMAHPDAEQAIFFLYSISCFGRLNRLLIFLLHHRVFLHFTLLHLHFITRHLIIHHLAIRHLAVRHFIVFHFRGRHLVLLHFVGLHFVLSEYGCGQTQCRYKSQCDYFFHEKWFIYTK